MNDNLQLQQQPISKLSKKRSIEILVFYALLFFIISFFVSTAFKYIPNSTEEYTAVDQIVNNLQIKYSVSYINSDELDNINENDIAKIDYYKIDNNYYLLTTKDLFINKNDINIDITFLYTTKDLTIKMIDSSHPADYKVDKYGFDDNSLFESHFNLEDNAFYSEKFKDGLKFTTTSGILINFTIYIIAFVVIGLLALKILKDDSLNLSKNSGILKNILIGVLILYSSNILSGFITLAFKALTKDNTITSLNQFSLIDQLGSKFAILAIVNIVIFAPIVEELVFRKAAFSLFKNKWVALVISSLVFGLIHVTGEQTALALLVNLIIYSLSGVALGYIYIKNDENIWIPIYVHLINNLISSILIIFL